MLDLSPLWSYRLVLFLLWFLFLFIHFSRAREARRRRKRQRRRTAECPTRIGRVERVLDGAALAAAACRTGNVSEPPPFVARFVLSTPQGPVLVEPSPSVLVGVDEVDIGDWIEVQGPLQATDADAYRDGTPGQVFRGTDECPLEIRAAPESWNRPPRARVAPEPALEEPRAATAEAGEAPPLERAAGR